VTRKGRAHRALGELPTDEEGRLILNMGSTCPVCGAGPDIKYSGDGRLVLRHVPADCLQTHVPQYRARQRRMRDGESDMPPERRDLHE